MTSRDLSPPRERLPKDHPDYLFPTSHNPYWHKIKSLKSAAGDQHLGAYSDHDAEVFRGRWREVLPGRLLHVEIGCNGAHVLLRWAGRSPEDAFIGLDWKFKQVWFGYEKGVRAGLRNMILLRTYAERLQYIFGTGEIDRLYLFFPDPWAKHKQQKHRLFSEKWLRQVAPLMRADGVFEIRTDHAEYFDWMLKEVAKLDSPTGGGAAPHTKTWQILDQTRDLHGDNPDRAKLNLPDVTLFEKIFIRDGIKINRLRLAPVR